MIKRTQRGDRFIGKEELLSTLYECRRRLIAIQTKATPFGPLDRSCGVAMASIDDMVEAATGDRTYFWEKGSTPPQR